MTLGTVYLAGPITGCEFDTCVDWRDKWVMEFLEEDIICLSPMRGKSYLSNSGRIKERYDEFPLCTDQGIMARDHFDCSRANVIVFNVFNAGLPSLGTTMEAAWGFRDHTPMVWIIEPKGNPHDHPMLRRCMDFRVTSEDEAKQIVRAILKPHIGHR